MAMRMPGIASVADLGRNVASGMFGNGLGTHMGSVGGFLSSTVGMAGLGAAAGAALGSQMDGNMVAPMAAGGAVAGAVALPAAGLAAQGMYHLGNAYLNGVVNAAPVVGKAALGVGGAIGAGALASGTRLFNAGVGMASNLVRFDTMTESLSKMQGQSLLGKITHTGGIKLTNPWTGMKAGAAAGWEAGESVAGKYAKGALGGVRGALVNGQTIFWGAAAVKGVASAFNEVNRNHMGTMDGQITRATPRIPSYADNAGATGDLVFAMNANRRG